MSEDVPADAAEAVDDDALVEVALLLEETDALLLEIAWAIVVLDDALGSSVDRCMCLRRSSGG